MPLHLLFFAPSRLRGSASLTNCEQLLGQGIHLPETKLAPEERMEIKLFTTLATLLFTWSCNTASADVSVQRMDYHGWKGCYRLANQACELIFVPQIGRIMKYGFLNGPNVLWEN